MSLLRIACLIIIGGCTIAVIWASIDCICWTNEINKQLREIQRSIECELEQQKNEHGSAEE